MTPERIIVESAYSLASTLPGKTLQDVAHAILTCSQEVIRSSIANLIPHHQHRNQALAFIDTWLNTAMLIDAQSVSMALQSAAFAEQKHRDAQSIELVWTGPESDYFSFRRTEQAIIQVLDAAQNRIILVCYAVYKIPNVAEALIRAAKRGVNITIILETPDLIEGKGEYNTIKALGVEVTNCSTVYFWPKQNRPHSENDKAGILHVKCAVADGKWLFLSSANLTQQAFTINMEMGILVRGGTIPDSVDSHFVQLIKCGQFCDLV